MLNLNELAAEVRDEGLSEERCEEIHDALRGCVSIFPDGTRHKTAYVSDVMLTPKGYVVIRVDDRKDDAFWLHIRFPVAAWPAVVAEDLTCDEDGEDAPETAYDRFRAEVFVRGRGEWSHWVSASLNDGLGVPVPSVSITCDGGECDDRIEVVIDLSEGA